MHARADLFLILVFVLCLILIRSFFRYRRQQLWHETARLALEKGQPLPAFGSAAPWNRWRRSGAWDLRRGLILIAVGAGIHAAVPGPGRAYGAIPFFMGIAFLLIGLFQLARRNKTPGPSEPPAQA